MQLVLKVLLCELAPLLNLISCRISWIHHTTHSLRKISHCTAKHHLAIVPSVCEPYFRTCWRPTSSEGGLAKTIRPRIIAVRYGLMRIELVRVRLQVLMHVLRECMF
jgi:hypothetical protein